jgi:hypothetical protein
MTNREREAQLRARLTQELDDADAEQTARWYMHVLRDNRVCRKDMSAFELEYFERCRKAFNAWMASRTFPSRTFH